MLSRDELITRGQLSAAFSEASYEAGRRTNQWIYYAKVKTGRNATINVEREYWTIPHLIGDLVEQYAIDASAISIYAIKRVMKKQLRSQREDI